MPVQFANFTSVSTACESATLVFVARVNNSRCSFAFCGCTPACSAIQFANKWSKSSPPSAVSPPVANTSNTPRLKRKIEMSKVPPPKSYTAITPSCPLSKPYAMAAAVGSFNKRNTFNPANLAASFVLWRCASSK